MSKRTFFFTVAFLLAALAGSILAGYWVVSSSRSPQGTSASLVGGPFSLLDKDGKRLSDKDLAGKFALVFFGYTYCPDICPTTLTVITQAMDLLDAKTAAQVEPVFVTIDPGRDTVETLADYAKHFHPKIHFLTGSQDEIAAIARAYRVYYQKVESKDGGAYLMDHSTITYLMGPDGRYRTHFGFDAAPEQIARDLKAMIGG